MDKEQPAFVKRVIKERDDLGKKIIDLDKYRGTEGFNGLSETNRLLLNQQLDVMRNYAAILDARLRNIAA